MAVFSLSVIPNLFLQPKGVQIILNAFLFTTSLALGSLKPPQHALNLIYFAQGAHGFKQLCGFGVGFFHHAQPLFEPSDGVFALWFVRKAQIKKLAYPVHDFLVEGGGLDGFAA